MKLQAWWEERSISERWVIGLGVPAFVLAMAVAAFFVLRPSYEVLFSGLAPQDMSNIANQLAVQKIPYQIDEEGARILVNRNHVHDARIRVMEAGIPLSRPVGFELFDNVDFGMTEFTQRINYQRALEGELTRTISALREIDHARLHLVLPESSLFGSDSTHPKAALTLAVKPGMSLSAERISGIQRLIASSVPGLEPAAVAIHDDKGSSLVADGQNISLTAIAARIEAKREIEAYLTRKAQSVLDRAFGPGSAVVVVDADIDNDQRQYVRDEVIPVKGGATGAVTSLRSLHGLLGKPTADVGEEDGAAEETVRSDPRSGDITTEVKYEPGRQHETVAVAQGALKRLTISVLVPPGTTSVVREAISAAVGNAVGVNIERGDSLSLQETPVSAPAVKGAQAVLPHAMPKAQGAFTLAPLGIVQLLLIALGISCATALLTLLVSRPRGGPRRLSPQELDRLRRELRSWIDQADKASEASL